jgi:serine/threonine-protein kinase
MRIMSVALRAGDVIGEYEILEPLGQGAFSRTFKARKRDGALVVLKFPDSAMLGDPGIYDRFQRELAIGQKLSHPNIAHAIEIGDSEAGPYLVLEYSDGISFRSYLEANTPLPVDEAVKIGKQLAAALEYAHSEGVCHRDLKPENLIISPEGAVYIVDFGVALLEGARRITWRFLSGTNVLGTPDYMSPEQIQGKRGDARSDVYSLGIMLYEMLTGRVPFQGDNPLAVMKQHLTDTPPSPGRFNQAIPHSVEGIVLKSIRKNPDERYHKASELLHDLEHYKELDPAQFVFGPERQARVLSDWAIWRLGIIIGIAFLLLVALVLLIVILVKHF